MDGKMRWAAIQARVNPIRKRVRQLQGTANAFAIARRMSAEFTECVYVSKGAFFASFVEGEGKEIVVAL